MESTGTSPRECEANASAAQEECPTLSIFGVALIEDYISVPHSEQCSGLSSGSLDTRELGEGARTSGRSEESQVGQASDVTMHPAHVSALIKALAYMIGHVPTLHLLLSLGHDALEWERIIDLNKCTESSEWWEPNTLCGIVLKEPNCAAFRVGVVHSGESITLSWHKLPLDRREPVNTISSGDGGLVCFCLTFPGEGDDLRLVLTVVNPLTGTCRVLPSDHGVSPFDLRMMQLVVDKSTRKYQVLLVHDEKEPSSASSGASQCGEMSEEEPGSEEFVEVSLEMQWFPETLGGVIFDSGTGVWRNARSSSQVFLGPAIHEERYVRDPGLGWKKSRDDAADTCMMDYQGSSRFFGPVAYDCATGKVMTPRDIFDGRAPWHQFALSKDRMFELYQRLVEYQIRVGKDHLGLQTVVEADHLTPEAHAKLKWPHSLLIVLACDGYLLVRGPPFEENFHRRISHRIVGLLYDMRVGKWADLRERRQDPVVANVDEVLEESDDTEEVKAYGDLPRCFESAPIMLCNLDWEAVP